MAKKNEPKGQEPSPGKPNQQKPGNDAQFQSLLSQVKDPYLQKEYEESRRNQPQKYNPSENRTQKNW
jgi:hypothetical protein